MNRLSEVLRGLALFGLLLAASPGLARAREFQKEVFTGASGGRLPYRLLAPSHPEAGRKYPLVIFLHGAGERGSDNEIQLRHFPKALIDPAGLEKFPCYAVAPQCATDKQWVDMAFGATRQSQPESPSEEMKKVLELIEHLQATQPIDPLRIYVTGMSMGGYGSWDLATRFPKKFAAAVPICGGGDEAAAPKLSGVPIWAFHSDDDPAVPVVRSCNMITCIRLAGGHPHYTEYHGLGHNSWTTAYADSRLFPWLFSQQLAAADQYHFVPSPENFHP